jgi:hypothetical protein
VFSALAFLMMVPAVGADDLTLEASVGADNARSYAFSSGLALGPDSPTPPLVVTEVVTNYTEHELVFSLKQGEKGVVAPAAKGLAGITPKSLTMIRTSYHLAHQVNGGVEGTDGGNHFAFTACRWLESPAVVQAFPGGALEARLIDGGPKGRVLVRCVCAVSGSRAKGYTYAYTVENLTDQPLRFRWAGLEGEVGPKRDFVKVEHPKELTAEESGLAVLDFGDKREYAVRANFWARPK